MANIGGTTETNILKLIYNATAWANYADNAATSPQTQIGVALLIQVTPGSTWREPRAAGRSRRPAQPAHRRLLRSTSRLGLAVRVP